MLLEHTLPGLAGASHPVTAFAPHRRGYCGDGRDVLLQAFHWASHQGAADAATGARKSGSPILSGSAEAIRQAGFTRVWMPPPSDSLAPQGYIPRRWNVLDTAYGSEAELRAALRDLLPV